MQILISFVCGLVAEFATGLTIGAGMYFTTGAAMPKGPADFPPWVAIVAIVAGSVFTFLFAYWRASRNSARAMMHALIVAGVAVAFHLASSIGAGQPMDAAHIVADVGKLVAGMIAGEMVRRRSAAAPASL
jgi:uncharacterized membrane protein YfcA